ncbi:MAG TPA: protoporphyrinogen oxidase HemJ [Gammaproteobacteria bacterium]|nr:protoporphyrinogen oxidase HemJ [Gammaproteobacteria bacterium]
MLWVKAFHIIFMVTWFAGLFYLPRLFVYHAMSEDDVSDRRFRVMERKLFYGIMTPGMILTLVFGLWMLWDYAWAAYADRGWLHLKMVLVVLLVAYHIYCGHLLNAFRRGDNRHDHVYYRWINEIPVLFLVAIVILVVVKPF